MTKTKYKIIIYATIALAAVGVLALLWYLFGAWVAAIAGGLGLGGGAVQRELQRWAEANEAEHQAQERADLELRMDLGAIAAREQQQREQLAAEAAAQAKATDATVDKATTTEQLGAAEDAERARLEAVMIPPSQRSRPIGEPGSGEDGYIRVGLVALLCLLVLCLYAICGSPAKARQATAADKARTKANIAAMRRAGVLIRDLRIQLDAERQRHQVMIKNCRAKARAAAARHRAQRAILLGRKPPPVWPHYVAAYGGATLLCGGMLALCVGLRK